MGNRIERVRKAMKQIGLENLIVTDSFNLIYLSGFHGLDGDGCMVITKEKAVLITDARYEVELKENLDSSIRLNITRNYYQSAIDELNDNDKAVGFEGSIKFNIYQKLEQSLEQRLVVTNDLIEKVRDVKDETEIGTLNKSCQLVSDAYSAVLNYVQVGMSEKEIARFIYDWMLDHGAEKPSFDTIVASGYHSAMPHAGVSDKKIQSGDLVTIDFGFYYNDYTSDMTRTFAVGNPGNELKKVYEIVKNAQAKMIEAMHDHANSYQVDAAARDYIKEQGYGKYYNHGGGHSIGLDIHERPILNPSAQGNIYNNYVMTAEPGIYLPNKGGIRIEDDILITKDGYKRLTTAPRELKII